MQSKLPDINSAIVTHRIAALRAYDHNDLQKGVIAIRSIIALLPEDFKLTISSEKYQVEKKATRKLECTHCHEETDFGQITVATLEHPPSKSILLRRKSYQIWICPNCKKDNDVEQTKSFLEQHPDPCYLKIIPNPPVKKTIFDRPGYEYSWKNWFELAFPEIEQQISLYRTEYVSQNPDNPIIDNTEVFEFDDETE